MKPALSGQRSLLASDEDFLHLRLSRQKIDVPISEKYLLTIREASVYFNLGVKNLRRIAENNTDSFSLRNGSRYLIIRPMFEKYLEEASSI